MKNLTAKFVREVTEPGSYHDGDAGLMLIVKATGRKSYMQRLTIHGKRHDIGLGSVRWTTLTEARQAAQANRKLARQGGDPLALRKRPDIPTFEAAAAKVIELHAATWRDGGKSEKQWRASLDTYAMPRLGRRRVDTITTADVMSVLLADGFWNEKRTTAGRVRQRIGAIMKWAVAQGYRQDNPAGDAIGAALPKNGNGKTHHAAVPHGDMAAAIEAVRRSSAGAVAKLAFELLVLTACRSGEVRGARWDEIDFGSATWTVPAERMKGAKEHRIPLSTRALAILAEARELSDGSDLVFPAARRGKPIADDVLSKMLRSLDIRGTVHGCRSTFRDWASERTNAPREVCEAALAHTVGGVEGAYARSDLFDRRRKLMESWARYLAGGSADVVALHGGT